ncbi:MAG: SRPBCC family protein [Bacteroidetes bacterium]|nr:SRPBCC family protein [Bacteroidota bacterium]
MRARSLKRVQVLPISIEKAWDFFSDPANLATITPPGMGFHILSDHRPTRMYAGQLIEYRVSPLLGIPMYWMTEITHVVEGKYFIDEQRFGPYTLWHHQHHFQEVAGGVEMTDIVHYKVPFGLLGALADRLFVRQKLKQIFDYRYQAVAQLFS